MESDKESRVSFRVTEDEHYRLKVLAAKERKTLKALFFEALERMFPDWKKGK